MRKIIIKKKTNLYILAPAGVATGGPECLHQLGYKLKKIFKLKNVNMVYLPLNNSKPVHKNYKPYQLRYSNFIEDNQNNILIIPEHYSFLKFSLNFKKIKKVIWWLSIDNYFAFKFNEENPKFLRSLIKIPFNIISLINRLLRYQFGILTYHDYLKFYYKFFKINNQKEIHQASFHLAQSFYAYNYLKKDLSNIELLYDYQNQKGIGNIKNQGKRKTDLICYSHKSNDFLDLVKSNSKVKFIKLENLNTNQIVNIFSKTKIYIDFGYHPGKDRMPREAVLFNNCIITNYKGSAKNKNDIPINEEFKFHERSRNITKIKSKINKILINYKNELKKFKRYKKQILMEEKTFKSQILKIFHKV